VSTPITDRVAKRIGYLAGQYKGGDIPADWFCKVADEAFDELRVVEAELSALRARLDVSTNEVIRLTGMLRVANTERNDAERERDEWQKAERLARVQLGNEREMLHKCQADNCRAIEQLAKELTEAQRERDELKQSIADLSHPNCRMLLKERDDAREESAVLRKQMGGKIEDFLNERVCCNGVDCGCMGVSRLEQYVHEAANEEIGKLRSDLAAANEMIKKQKTP
jgi:hypothetical protein